MKRTSQYPTDSLFKGLRTLLASLPSEDERIELIRTLSEARKFLEELQQLIEVFPTTESSQGLSQGLSHLDILADRASRDAPLRRLLGLRSSQSPRSKGVNSAEDIKSRAKRLEQRLDSSESSKVASLIEQSGEPISVLIELAASLGLRTRKKERKAELVNRIATHTTNQRGYRLLRGSNADPIDDGVARTVSRQQ